MKAKKISVAMILYCEVSRKYLDEIAFGLAKFKKLSRSNSVICANLKGIKNRLFKVYIIYLENSDFGL